MSNDANLIYIAPTVAAYGGANIAWQMPFPVLAAAGHDASGERAFAGTMPSATLSARGGANAALEAPMGLLTITATSVGLGTAALAMPAPTLASSATATGKGSAALTFGSIGVNTYSLVGYSGAVLSVTLTGGYTLAATGTTGNVGGAALTLPLYDLTASGSQPNMGDASLLMPSARLGAQAQAWLAMPSATLTAVGTAVVAVTYEAYAVNLNHTPRPGVDLVDEVTHYTNYAFDRIVRYKNSYYGMNSTGLYLLEGVTTDTWAVQTAETDFKSAQKKTVETAYFGGRMPPASTVSLIARENAANTYNYTTPRGAHAQNYRQAFGRGIKARYYALGLSGTDHFDLDSVTLNVTTLARKV
jgi:hypothetical protein